MHSDEHAKALKAYKSLHGPPVREVREAPLAASILGVEKVLRQSAGQFEHSGFVLTRPTENIYVCASVIDDNTVNAFADKFGNTYFATVHSAAAFCLFDLAAGLWSDRGFLPKHGDVSRLPQGYAPDYAVPRGLERLAKRPSTGNRAPGWLSDFLVSACHVRLQAFEQTVLLANTFLWRHELAHIALGHVDFHKERVPSACHAEATDGDRLIYNSNIPNAVHTSFEVEADRLAVDAIFNQQYSKAARADATGSSASFSSQLVITFLAVILFAIALNARDELIGTPDAVKLARAQTHPPLWFRVSDALRSEARAYQCAQRTQAPTSILVSEQWRFNHTIAIADAIRNLCNCHALYGRWLGPIAINSEVETEAEAYQLQLARAIDPMRGSLESYRRPWASKVL